LRAAPIVLVLAAAGLGWAFRRNALDDPYVTYRYAENIVAGLGPVYNPGERVLSTTALGYALLLAALSPLAELPRLSNLLSAVGLGALALALHRLAGRNCHAGSGFAAGLLALASPLLLSTFGLETCLFLGLVAWSAVAWDAGRWRAAAALIALATVLRSDGALAFAVLAAASALRERRLPLGAAALYAAIVLPYEAALALYYGSPTPTTLAAKVAQATIGGWPDYLGGLAQLVAERLGWTPLFWLAPPLLLLGAAALPRHRWALPLVAWGAAQAVAYQLLGVASYSWYYAPLVPAAALLVGLGADALTGRSVALLRGESPPPERRLSLRERGRTTFAVLIPVLVVVPLLWAQLVGVRGQRANTPDPRSLAYESVGRWLDANAAPTERVAVMEVGIMGYYARRPMVDLLGLIRPETIDALRRQDFFWTIADTQVEFIVLTGKNPLWFQFAEPGHWFHQLYGPVHRVEQPGFWGTPLTVYRRQAPPRQPPELDERPADLRFGDAARLERVAVERLSVRAGDYLTVQLFWRAEQPHQPAGTRRDYSAFVHVVSAEPKVVAQHDSPVSATRWPAGEAVQYYHPMRLPDDLAPGRYTVEVGLYLPEEPLRRLPPSRPHPRDVAVVAEITAR
jgi:hypothetical protein